MEREHPCELCDDTGVMTWLQPVPNADGTLTMKQMNHPCVNGCSGWFKLPVRETSNVVDPSAGDAAALGNVARANLHHRTDWLRPALPQQDRGLTPPG
ncbi:hypothetical protein SK854_13615 [Lentzea sp. BCCO 10_0061]|uniref:Uncharacterized protein n=1 Tax=Lentzea sokolovensis TaxID=3095429 RepID=A0ABU4UV64_9PSEU|nr:hypothetical protein [Lentzea sp. BCCO 10_0061]MDX8143160.1 hypothetical protein [Lentzea sp. BCCO 10_0061]